MVGTALPKKFSTPSKWLTIILLGTALVILISSGALSNIWEKASHVIIPSTSSKNNGWENGQIIVHGGSAPMEFWVPFTPTSLVIKNAGTWRMKFIPPSDSNSYYVIQSLGRINPDTVWQKKKGLLSFRFDERYFLIWTNKPSKVLIVAQP